MREEIFSNAEYGLALNTAVMRWLYFRAALAFMVLGPLLAALHGMPVLHGVLFGVMVAAMIVLFGEAPIALGQIALRQLASHPTVVPVVTLLEPTSDFSTRQPDVEIRPPRFGLLRVLRRAMRPYKRNK